MSAVDVTMRKLRPFGGRVTLIESAVDTEERASGLLVPVGAESDVKRGVVLHADEPQLPWATTALAPGTPVYYFERNAIAIGDVFVLDYRSILAYEADE